MDARPRPEPEARRLARFRWPLIVVVIAAIGLSAGFAFARSGAQSAPASKTQWSRADWIADDPALDPTEWKDARYVEVDCASMDPPTTGGRCWLTNGFPEEVSNDTPDPWPERKLWCEQALSRGESAGDPWCDAQRIPASYPAPETAELEAYGVDRAFGEGEPVGASGQGR